MGGGDDVMVCENHYETNDRKDNNTNSHPKNPATNLRKQIYVLPSGRKLKVVTSDEDREHTDG
jgi:hypothetical protein